MEIISIGRNDIHIAAQLFQPERLTLARELKGVTRQDLASRVNKTASAISQFESGRTRPDGPTLGQIAIALGVQLQFFITKMSTDLLKVDECHFRSLRSASQKQRKRLLATGSLLSDIFYFCEEYIDLPEEKITPNSRTVLSDTEVEDFAIELRRSWGLGLGPIPDIIKLFESNGIVVTIIPDACHEVNAFSTWVKQRPVIFLSYKGFSSVVRFDAAHELLHLLAHADAAPGDKILERQANKFGGCFLLPRDSFLNECPKRLNWDHFFELKRRWGVSYRCLVRRAYELGCLSEASYKRAYVQLNRMGPEQGEPPLEQPTLLRKSIKMIAEEIPVSEIANKFGLNLADFFQIIGVGESDSNLLSKYVIKKTN